MAIQVTDTAIIHPAGTTTFADIASANTALQNASNFKKSYEGVAFEKTAPASLIVKTGTTILVGSSVIKTASDYTLSLDSNLDTGSKVAGTDYYIYAKEDGSFYISADKTISTDRLIGGFHYGLTGETETATGNKTASDMAKIQGINAYSFWDLKFRPVSEPEGMFYAKGRWYDIYLMDSEYALHSHSRPNASIAGGTTDYGRAIPKIPTEFGGDGTLTYGKFTWFQACEVAKAAKKQLIPYEEFVTIAYGVVEGTDSSTVGEAVQGNTEHYAELTSIFGMEQATGVQYVWGSNIGTAATGSWTSITDGRGQVYQDANAVLLGGSRAAGAAAGSRCSIWNNSVSYSAWNIGARFASDHLSLV